jgi:hypothetical protein
MKKQILIALFFIASTTTLMAQKAEVFNLSGTAIKGYDPVAYFKEGKPVKGNEKLSYNWNNAKWHFVSNENLDASPKARKNMHRSTEDTVLMECRKVTKRQLTPMPGLS